MVLINHGTELKSHPVKVHIICRHFVPFLQKYLLSDNGFAVVSEQGLESSHHHFNMCGKDTYPVRTGRICEGLFNAVCDFNFISLATDDAAAVWEELQNETESD
ncbi:hypothetical protein LOD99_1527 [Oopsacas minuta]|uniref:Uncharacterized protein n=1 Tax=Oopsacas minuta TaxID=111878 RepID=A0AAV7K6W0_9METZ|nr:hypothetical protein LOD99_1527 [Oopsacas minuta]